MIYWASKLEGITNDQLKHAMDNLPDMPPSLPQFLRLCKAERPSGAAYRPCLPPVLPKRNKEFARAAFAGMKATLKGAE